MFTPPRLTTLLCLLILSCTWAYANTEDLADAFAELDAEFDPTFVWWAEVYDPVSGGCYYGLSGKDARAAGELEFGPDIEATSKLVGVCDRQGFLQDEALQRFRERVVNYIQVRQNPQSGFFRDPEFYNDYTPKTLNRAVGMSEGVLKRCGGKALFALPYERLGDNEEARGHFAHLSSPEAFRAWLEERPWEDRIWTVGSDISSNIGNLKQLDVDQRQALLDVLGPYLASHQADDGYYGRSDPSDNWWSRLSGTYKVYRLLESMEMPMPMPETLRDTVLHDLHEREYDNVIVLYNTIKLLTILDRNGAPLTKEQKRDVLEQATNSLKAFRVPDGGFTTLRDRPCPRELGKTLGKPVVEGNTNATGLALSTRAYLYELVGGQQQPPIHPRSGDLFKALAADNPQ